MAACLVLESTESKMVGMGQILLARPPATLHSVLGSCIGLTLYYPRMRLVAMAHIVLPDSSGRPAAGAKFADHAIPAMILEMEKQGAHRGGLVAKMTGGACMFGGTGPLQVGLTNVDAVAKALAAVGIRIAAQDVGGSKGRRAVFDPATGSYTVEVVGMPPKIL
jgi:chemotaxis protein CheD